MEESLRRLLALAHQQKEALRDGLLDRFFALMTERTRVFERLQMEVSGGALRPEWSGVVAEIVRIDGENAAVLQSFLQDLVEKARDITRLEAGATAYLHAVGATAGGRLLDGRR